MDYDNEYDSDDYGDYGSDDDGDAMGDLGNAKKAFGDDFDFGMSPDLALEGVDDFLEEEIDMGPSQTENKRNEETILFGDTVRDDYKT